MAESKAAQGEKSGESKQRADENHDDIDNSSAIETFKNLCLCGDLDPLGNLWDFIQKADDPLAASLLFLRVNILAGGELNHRFDDPIVSRHCGAALAKVLSAADDRMASDWGMCAFLTFTEIEKDGILKPDAIPLLGGFIEAGGVGFALKICGDDKILSKLTEKSRILENYDPHDGGPSTIRLRRLYCLIRMVVWCSIHGGKQMEMALRGIYEPIIPIVIRLLREPEIVPLSTQLFLELLRARKGHERMRDELLSEMKMPIPENQYDSSRGLPDVQKKSISWLQALSCDYRKDSCNSHQTFVSALRVILTLLPGMERKMVKKCEKYIKGDLPRDSPLGNPSGEIMQNYHQLALIKTLARDGWFTEYLPDRIYQAQVHLEDHKEKCLTNILSDYLQVSLVCSTLR